MEKHSLCRCGLYQHPSCYSRTIDTPPSWLGSRCSLGPCACTVRSLHTDRTGNSITLQRFCALLVTLSPWHLFNNSIPLNVILGRSDTVMLSREKVQASMSVDGALSLAESKDGCNVNFINKPRRTLFGEIISKYTSHGGSPRRSIGQPTLPSSSRFG